MRFCSVILRDSVRQTDRFYTYIIPDDMEIYKGSYVNVPFGKGNKLKIAVVYDILDDKDIDSSGLKYIDSLLDELPVMTEEQLKIIVPISKRYNCTMGDVICLMVPSMVGKRKQTFSKVIYISDIDECNLALKSNSLRSVAHINILEYLLEFGSCEKKKLMLNVGCSSAQIKSLLDKGLIIQKDEINLESGEENLENDLDEKYLVRHEINEEQQNAIDKITDFSEGRKPINLLYGITGSGKTEVYLNCAEKIMNMGYSVLYMVPEISLTPQTISWIKGRLGGKVAVLHSKLSEKQRHEQWDLIRRGMVNVVVAPRSGIFAPISNLKLIIVDEEHDSSYKSSDSHPHYNTKDIALMRARLSGAKIVLGSATPSVESFYAATNGFYELIKLTSRANPDAKLPTVYPVDMKEQVKSGYGDILSMPLRHAMARAFSEKKQVMLFLNRRGYSRTLVCNDCGEQCTCKYCSVGMTLHNNRRSNERLLICHYCGRTIPVSLAECQNCGGNHFTKVGFGTQQLEELLKEQFPHEKVLRMDQDTTTRAGSHEDIISQFSQKEASILIGTQMIAKGHDFSDVTVVGILGADLMLASGSVKASERAFQLITQASGRAGRGDNPGEVYIQSYNPDEALFRYAASQNYEAFYAEEIKYREKLKLPPFKALGDIVLSDDSEEIAKNKADILGRYIKEFLANQDGIYEFEVMGPVPDIFYELRGKYRYNISIKATNKSAINAVFKQIIEDFDPKVYQISFDNDAAN